MSDKTIWVVMDLRDRRFFDGSLNVLSLAASLSERAGTVPVAVIAGPQEGSCPDFSEAASEASAHGAERVLRLVSPSLQKARPDVTSRALARAVESLRPALVLFPLSDFSRETAARLAVMRNAGLIADCEALSFENGGFVADCPSWGGRVMARIGFAEGAEWGCATVNPTAFLRLRRERPAMCEVYEMDLGALDAPPGLALISSKTEERDPRGLEQAETVVVGGAGAGGSEGFGRLRELAAALSGQLGATRPAVLNHWADESRLIGQTGKTVAPRLLISVGASGAIQYTAGIAGAGCVVAVNRDKSAPIFDCADLGVVADATLFIPVLVAKVKAAVLGRLARDVCGAGEPAAGPLGGTGALVKKLREARQWSREDLAQATGQSPESILDVEENAVTPSVGFLLRLARALDVDPAAFLNPGEREQVAGLREQAYTRRTENYSYQTLTPGAEWEHLRAFLITIEPKKAHKPVDYKHEGEEFVYVLTGDLELSLDGKPQTLKPGESRHFNSMTPHKLKSLSESETCCLVVLYTP